MDTEKVKKILKYTTYVDKFKYHNQIINFFDKFYDKEDFPKILINFDLHSDMKFDYACIENNIANWVNHTFGRYGIDEYYWVIPKHAIKDENFIKFFDENKNKTGGNYTKKDYTDFSVPLKQSFPYRYLKNKVYTKVTTETDDKILEYIEKQEKEHKLIHVYYCTEDNLPDFGSKDVLVSVDADYFSNNGFDTFSNYKYTPKNIQQEFDKFIDCLYEKHIFPWYMGLCLSTNYAQDLKSSEEFYDKLINTYHSPVKLNIDYTYTDLKEDNYEKYNGYFYASAHCVNLVYLDDKVSHTDFEKLLKPEEYEDGFYDVEFYAKEEKDSFDNRFLNIYPHQVYVTKIAERNNRLIYFLDTIKCKLANQKTN